MSDDPPDGGVIQIVGSTLSEEGSLQDAGRELCVDGENGVLPKRSVNLSCTERTNAVLKWRVVGIDDGRPPVRDPIGLVDRLTQPLERVVGAEHGEIERVA